MNPSLYDIGKVVFPTYVLFKCFTETYLGI